MFALTRTGPEVTLQGTLASLRSLTRCVSWIIEGSALLRAIPRGMGTHSKALHVWREQLMPDVWHPRLEARRKRAVEPLDLW